MRFSRHPVVLRRICVESVNIRLAACNHPSLVNKDYKMDSSAIEPKAASKGHDADDDGDDLAAMFGSLGVSNARRCQVCQIEYVFICHAMIFFHNDVC